MRALFPTVLLASISLPSLLFAGAPAKKEKTSPAPHNALATRIAEQVRDSVVVVLYTGRDGRQIGMGSGFVVGKDGLIATNLHVIGEGRPIIVRLPDGKKVEASEVFASDRNLDLALIRVPVKNLKPLPLGDSQTLKNGQPLVALGHPRGLEYSVVAGVLSGRRDIDGLSMLQLAVPIEQGNSGGPVLDEKGRVVGVVTMKSLVTNNLGFAVPSAKVKLLLERPNPVPIDSWLTLGALDPSEWKIAYGGRWRQRAGRIQGDGMGSGFGGRTLCLHQLPTPKLPFELTVAVKLDDEGGAAGLIFGGKGEDRHYGFYPSGGKLRLTWFDGADVFSWKILEEIRSEHYRPGEWNTLKVRLEKDRFLCFVNGHKVAEVDDPKYPGTVLGLARFRGTEAEFKRFQAAPEVQEACRIPPALAALLEKAMRQAARVDEPRAADLRPLAKNSAESLDLIRRQAAQLEQEAARLRKLAKEVHHQSCLDSLRKVAEQPEKNLDLARGALLLARLDNEEIDVDQYLRELDRLAAQVRAATPKDADEKGRLEALNKFLFQDRGFHGSRMDYYTRSNSYLNEVLDDREGLPITLSVVYMELAARLGLKVVGVPLPGHFMVRHEPAKGKGQLVDVFERGKSLTLEQAKEKVRDLTGNDPEPEDLKAADKKSILSRMLHNLINVAQEEKDRDSMLRYLDAILVLDADAHAERWVRAVFRYQAGRREGALADCDYLLDRMPPDADLARVRELKSLLLKR